MNIEQVKIMYNKDFNYKGNFLFSDKLLIICFFQKNIDFLPNILKQIKSYFPNSDICGCSGAGEIYEDEINDDFIVVNFIKLSNESHFNIKEYNCQVEFSREVGTQVGKDLSQFNSNGTILFSDGLALDGAKFTEGVNSSKKINTPILGGLAGDGVDFKSTFIILNQEIKSKCLIAIYFTGKVKFSVSSASGWCRFGFEHKITKAKDNVVFEIDNLPALDFYKEYLGKESEKLPASGLHFPLQILSKSDEKNSESLSVVRTLLGVSEAEKSLTFAGSFLENSNVDLLKATSKNLINAASENINRLKSEIGKNQTKNMNVFSLIVSCVGRRLTMNDSTEEELVGYKELNYSVIQSGFYSYGEISSSKLGNCLFHNQTLTQALIWEDDV